VRAPSIVVAILLAAGLGACGGTSDEDKQANSYVTAVNAAQTRFSTSIARIGAETKGTEVTTATVDRWAGAVERMRRDLRAIEAPDEVDRLHTRLVDEITGFRGTLRKARRALRSGNRKTILAERARLVVSARRATKRIETTLTSIDRTLGS
jgi:hypothetical protein